jgi:hypothetical protein
MPCEKPQALPVNGFVLPSNEAIASALLLRFKDYIIGCCYKMGVKYSLSPEDREDMRHEVFAKFLSIDWRTVFRDNKLWIKNNIDHPSRNWSAEDAAFVLKSYAVVTILNTLRRASWQTKNFGLTGLGGTERIGDIPFSESLDAPNETDVPRPEPSVDGQEDRTAARQVVKIAKEILEPQEWLCLSLHFGFDGGGTRTPAQVAREADLPRKKTQQLMDGALAKLKTRCSR